MFAVLFLIFSFSVACFLNVAADNSLNVAHEQKQIDVLQRTSFLLGLTTVSDTKVIGAQCHEQLQQVQRGVLEREPWAIKMYDASGMRYPGFTYGHNYWFGSRDTCDATQHAVKLELSPSVPRKTTPELYSQTAPFATDYRMVYLRHNSTLQMDVFFLHFDPHVHVGLCLPSACTTQEIEWLMANYVSSDAFVQQDIYDMRLQVTYVKDLKVRQDVYTRPSFYLMNAFLFFTFAMTCAAGYLRRKHEKKSEAAECRINSDAESKNATPASYHEISPFARIIACYDMRVNWPKCFGNAVQRKGGISGIPAINGIRFTSALGVTLFHTLICSYMFTANKLTMFKYVCALGNLDIFIDVFFTISGVLQGYYFFRNTTLIKMIQQKNVLQNLHLFGYMCLQRLIRLVPMYWFVTWSLDVGFRMLDDVSLFHFDYRVYELFERFWLRNLIFIQNFFPAKEMVLFWSWSLGCDMQYFVLSTLLLLLYVKRPRTGKISVATILLVNVLYTLIVGTKIKFTMAMESTLKHITEIYMNPVSRIMAYVFGVVTGWYLVQYQQQLKTRKREIAILGHLALVVFFTCTFTTVTSDSVIHSLVLLVFQRFLFSLSTCILLVVNVCGQLSWFFWVFESGTMQKFSKTSYAFSLLNPALLFTMQGLQAAGIHANLLTIIVQYFGVILVLLFLATIFTLFFDIPYRNITDMLQRKKAKAV